MIMKEQKPGFSGNDRRTLPERQQLKRERESLAGFLAHRKARAVRGVHSIAAVLKQNFREAMHRELCIRKEHLMMDLPLPPAADVIRKYA
jgi:hypothetical protein